MDLDQRSEQILTSIIEQYTSTAEPVGSRNLAKIPSLALSAATIRNVMSDLTTMGLIHQLHTSAGRVPTDKGYRYYVDLLQKNSKGKSNFVPKNVSQTKRPKRIEDILHSVTEELVLCTDCTSVILSPKE